MIQELAVTIIITMAFAYVAYRIYSSIKKKQACDKCVLMEAAKKASK